MPRTIPTKNAPKRKLEADGLTHSRPGSVDEELEDSFPASDPPAYSGGGGMHMGAPQGHDRAKPAKAKKKPVKKKLVKKAVKKKAAKKAPAKKAKKKKAKRR